ncbi:hypothetical protein AB0395_48615, partial [Streptosporangium sp. NPDC051023]|uniref:hypothetical protein n=1 Tax=Streptosporangium sp. NPDC051023 TaxID=3155410 RepID=UPI00344C2893
QPGAGCRCAKCRKAATRYRAQQRVAAILGTHQPDVDADRCRQHVVMLRNHGMDVPSIAHEAGLGASTVSELLYGGKKTVRPRTQAALLAVRPHSLDRPGLTLALGTRRRLHALSAMGYPASLISRESGVGRDRLLVIMSSVPPARVTVATARRVTDAYRRLCLVDPATCGVEARIVRTLRRQAAAKGWASPLAWDNIDDPAATPQGLRKEAAS